MGNSVDGQCIDLATQGKTQLLKQYKIVQNQLNDSQNALLKLQETYQSIQQSNPQTLTLLSDDLLTKRNKFIDLSNQHSISLRDLEQLEQECLVLESQIKQLEQDLNFCLENQGFVPRKYEIIAGTVIFLGTSIITAFIAS